MKSADTTPLNDRNQNSIGSGAGRAGAKEVVVSTEGVSTSAIFKNQTRPGTIKRKFFKESAELGLNNVIKSCPVEFLPTLTAHLKYIRENFNANERELVMVADALVANLQAYMQKTVKAPMTAEEALAEVRSFLEQ